MNFSEKLANVVNRYSELESLIIDPALSSEEMVKMNKEMASLAPIVEAIKQFNSLEQNLNDAKEMMNDSSLDSEMKKLAEEEYLELKEALPEKEKEIKILLLPKDDDDEKKCYFRSKSGNRR